MPPTWNTTNVPVLRTDRQKRSSAQELGLAKSWQSKRRS